MQLRDKILGTVGSFSRLCQGKHSHALGNKLVRGWEWLKISVVEIGNQINYQPGGEELSNRPRGKGWHNYQPQ